MLRGNEIVKLNHSRVISFSKNNDSLVPSPQLPNGDGGAGIIRTVGSAL